MSDIKIKEEWLQKNGKYKCPECNKEYSKKGICTHIFRMHTEEGKNIKLNHDPNIGYKNGTRQAWNKGKKSSKETKQKISKANKGKKYTEEQKKYLSECMKKSNKVGGYRKGSGHGKHGYYKGYWCDSSWELAFVIYNLDHNISFIRNTQGFNYEFNDEIFKYYPDFIMEDGSYIEIKGYEDNKAKAKHSQFKYKLKVLYSKEIQMYLDYAIKTYGKDFIKLYE
jgi:hypothetical protein